MSGTPAGWSGRMKKEWQQTFVIYLDRASRRAGALPVTAPFNVRIRL